MAVSDIQNFVRYTKLLTHAYGGHASVALSVASRYALPGYGESGFEAQAGPIIVSGYSTECFEIKFSGRHRGFGGVLFNL